MFERHPIRFVTPLPPGLLRFRSMRVQERLSRPFECHIECVSRVPLPDFSALVGERASVELDLDAGGVREWNGVITEFALHDARVDRWLYRATLRPWLSRLAASTNCRIFLNKTVIDVVRAVFAEHGATDFVEHLTATYPVRESIAQYRESDFAFVSRLLEDVGVYYHFQHHERKDVLVLCDEPGSHTPAPGGASVPFRGAGVHGTNGEFVSAWSVDVSSKPGRLSFVDYDFKQPQKNLTVQRQLPKERLLSDHEVFDHHPEAYLLSTDGETRARVRLDALTADRELVTAHTNARGLATGTTFALRDHPVVDQNREHLITAATYELTLDVDGDAATEESRPLYAAALTAMPSARPFRPLPSIDKPRVGGPQTAVVVGPAGSEIWTDEHGRVKVQFRWDRFGASDEHSSCWVRVAQVWAGGGYGALHIPRVGNEVIVDFLEGDPDQPIITGSVYNGANPPPFALPADKTRSGLKTRSTPGGGGSNELRFEDRAGQEEIFVHAQKNFTSVVENDETVTIGGNRTVTITGDETVSISGSRTINVKGNQSLSISGGGAGGVHGALNVTGKAGVNATDTIDLQAPSSITLTCGGSSIKVEPGKITFTAGGGAELVLDPNVLLSSASKSKLELSSTAALEASGKAKLGLSAEAHMESAGGQSAVTLNADALVESTGAVATLKGTNAKVEGTADAVMKGVATVTADSSGVTLDGSKVNLLGGEVHLQGSDVHLTGIFHVN